MPIASQLETLSTPSGSMSGEVYISPCFFAYEATASGQFTLSVEIDADDGAELSATQSGVIGQLAVGVGTVTFPVVAGGLYGVRLSAHLWEVIYTGPYSAVWTGPAAAPPPAFWSGFINTREVV